MANIVLNNIKSDIAANLVSPPYQLKIPSPYQDHDIVALSGDFFNGYNDATKKLYNNFNYIEIPDCVLSIGGAAFRQLTGLTSIRINNPNIYIVSTDINNVFSNLLNLSTIYYRGSLSSWNSNNSLVEKFGILSVNLSDDLYFLNTTYTTILSNNDGNFGRSIQVICDEECLLSNNNAHYYFDGIYTSKEDLYNITKYSNVAQHANDDYMDQLEYKKRVEEAEEDGETYDIDFEGNYCGFGFPIIYFYETKDDAGKNFEIISNPLYKELCQEQKILTYSYTDEENGLATFRTSDIYQKIKNALYSIGSKSAERLVKNYSNGSSRIAVIKAGSDCMDESEVIVRDAKDFDDNFEELSSYITSYLNSRGYIIPSIDPGPENFVNYCNSPTMNYPVYDQDKMSKSYQFGVKYSEWQDFAGISTDVDTDNDQNLKGIIGEANRTGRPVLVVYSSDRCPVCDNFDKLASNTTYGEDFTSWLIQNKVYYYHYRNPMRQGEMQDDKIIDHPIFTWIKSGKYTQKCGSCYELDGSHKDVINSSNIDTSILSNNVANVLPACTVYIPGQSSSSREYWWGNYIYGSQGDDNNIRLTNKERFKALTQKINDIINDNPRMKLGFSGLFTERDILLKDNAGLLNSYILNKSFTKLYANDDYLLRYPDFVPNIWENRWYNDDTVVGYSKGYTIWKNHLYELSDFLLEYSDKIYDYVKNNVDLMEESQLFNYSYKDYYYSYVNADNEISSSFKEASSLYSQVLSGYRSSDGSLVRDPLFEIGTNVSSDQLEIYVSLIDDNKAMISDDNYWMNLSMNETSALSIYLDMQLSNMMADHLAQYHNNLSAVANSNDILNNYMMKDLSGFNINNIVMQNKITYHKKKVNKEGFDCVRKFIKIPVKVYDGSNQQYYKWFRLWNSGYLEHGGVVECVPLSVGLEQIIDSHSDRISNITRNSDYDIYYYYNYDQNNINNTSMTRLDIQNSLSVPIFENFMLSVRFNWSYINEDGEKYIAPIYDYDNILFSDSNMYKPLSCEKTFYSDNQQIDLYYDDEYYERYHNLLYSDIYPNCRYSISLTPIRQSNDNNDDIKEQIQSLYPENNLINGAHYTLEAHHIKNSGFYITKNNIKNLNIVNDNIRFYHYYCTGFLSKKSLSSYL